MANFIATFSSLEDITGVSRNGCYLGITNNCSSIISKEHFISRVVLKEFESKGGVEVTGFESIPIGQIKKLPLSGMSSNILCDRHNSAFCELDDHAGQFFRNLKSIARARSPNAEYSIRKKQFFIMSGDMLEAWMIKTMLGLIYSGNSYGPDGKVKDFAPPDMKLVLLALFKNEWLPKCGLYIQGIGNEIVPKWELDFSIRCGKTRNLAYGIEMRIYGISIVVIFDDCGGNLLINGGFHRPTALLFWSKKQCHELLLAWSPNKVFSQVGVNFIDETTEPNELPEELRNYL